MEGTRDAKAGMMCIEMYVVMGWGHCRLFQTFFVCFYIRLFNTGKILLLY